VHSVAKGRQQWLACDARHVRLLWLAAGLLPCHHSVQPARPVSGRQPDGTQYHGAPVSLHPACAVLSNDAKVASICHGSQYLCCKCLPHPRFATLQTDTDPPVLPPNASIDNTADYTIVQTQSSTTDMGCAKPLRLSMSHLGWQHGTDIYVRLEKLCVRVKHCSRNTSQTLQQK
jgi:hypothetical protein